MGFTSFIWLLNLNPGPFEIPGKVLAGCGGIAVFQLADSSPGREDRK